MPSLHLCLSGLQDQFDGVLGANFMGDFCKPDPEAFEKVRGLLLLPAACAACFCAAQTQLGAAMHSAIH